MEGSMSANDRAQDEASLQRELDTRFRGPLMAYFIKRVGNRSEAEDLTQETFVRLIGSASFATTFDEAQYFVFRVASNLLRDRARTAGRLKRQTAKTVEITSISEFTREIAEDREPERVLIGRESLAAVFQTLDELGDKTKSIFILFRLEGMKHKDIAALYGIGVSSVEKHIIAASALLAKRYGQKP
jgi:RNA polymerase sigma factor (sigma-70 family)